jgi:hypothetical protein
MGNWESFFDISSKIERGLRILIFAGPKNSFKAIKKIDVYFKYGKHKNRVR